MPVVLISGGTGLVGANLTRHLLERNYEVIILTRDKNKLLLLGYQRANN